MSDNPNSTVMNDKVQGVDQAGNTGNAAENASEMQVPEDKKPVKVFISYAREDVEIAKKLCNDIMERAGEVKPWLDEKDLLPGENWDIVISEEIKECDFFLTLLSSHTLSKEGYVHKELKMAMNRFESFPYGDVFIIPVRLEDCWPRHSELKKIHWVNIFPPYNYDEGLEKILLMLRKEIKRRELKKKKLEKKELEKKRDLASKDEIEKLEEKIEQLKKEIRQLDKRKIPNTIRYWIILGSLFLFTVIIVGSIVGEREYNKTVEKIEDLFKIISKEGEPFGSELSYIADKKEVQKLIELNETVPSALFFWKYHQNRQRLSKILKNKIQVLAQKNRDGDKPNRYLARIVLEGIDLSNIDLTNANFRYIELKGANFRGANLYNADFRHAKYFDDVDFRGANLSEADFRNSDLDGVDFSGAKSLRLAKFEGAKLKQAKFIKVDLFKAKFNCCKEFTDADFKKSELVNADFYKANLSGVIFTEANLNGTKFTHARLHKVTLDNVRKLGIEQLSKAQTLYKIKCKGDSRCDEMIERLNDNCEDLFDDQKIECENINGTIENDNNGTDDKCYNKIKELKSEYPHLFY